MTTRSIVLSTAALMLLAAAAPAPIGFAPTPVLAQNVSADVAAALADDPAGLSPDQLRQHINTLQRAIHAGAVDAGRARAKMRAYGEELGARRTGRQQQQAEPSAERAGKAAERQRRQQEKQAEKERRQQEKQAEQARRVQEKQAERERRQRKKQAEQARRLQEKQAERERWQQEQAEQARRQQEQKAERQRQLQEQVERERRQREKRAEEARRQKERQAERERQREQERQAERERQREQEREAERERQREQERQAERERQREQERQAQQSERRQTAAQVLGDNRRSEALEVQELRQRIQRLRDAIETDVLSGNEVRAARRQIRADREELRSRLAERQREEESREEQRQARERTRLEEAPRGEVASRAQALLADDTPARRLRDRALRRRLQETRAVLASGHLSRNQERALRQRLRDDREEMRSRRSEEASTEDRSQRTSRSETTINIDVILDQRRPSERLSEEELEWRVNALQQALVEERMARRDAEIARHIVEQDRRELRQRLRHQRERRREALYRARDRDQLNIDFHIGYRPPPVIYAAEAAMEEIEVQLVAPPLYQPPRAYSFQEIATNHQVRQAMPGIELDTLNFDFGSAEVRPEEIEKLDTIAEVIERIVTARPDEVFLIEGHTDAVGSDAANLALSRARAAAVEEALIYYYAIDPANLRTVGLGEHFLRIPTPEPEEENRRVTVRRITPLLAGRG